MQTEENREASGEEVESSEFLKLPNSSELSTSTGSDESSASPGLVEPSIEIEIAASYPLEVKLDLADGDDDPSRTHDYKLSWRPTETHIFVSAEGRKMCHVGLVRHSVKVRGVSVDVAGVGGVLVRSGERGNGYGRAAMDAAEAFVAREWKAEFMLLFCREALRSWYDALGWRKVLAATWAEQPNGAVVLPLESMWKSLSGARWPDGDVYLHSRPW
jgi:GNAT superfamily N-acetyltransferase